MAAGNWRANARSDREISRRLGEEVDFRAGRGFFGATTVLGCQERTRIATRSATVAGVEAVLFIGIQGSGKTTFYRERLFDTHVRISRDMLKTRNRELLLVRACLAARQAFVVDDTNASKTTRADYVAAARAGGFRVVGYYFRTPLRTALARNRRRPPGQVIPVPGVLATFKRFQPPEWAEGFDELQLVEVSGENEVSVRPWTPEEGDPPGLERE